MQVQVLLFLQRAHLLGPRPLLRVVPLLRPEWLAPPLAAVVLAQQLLLVALALAHTQTGWGQLLLLLLVGLVLARSHIGSGRTLRAGRWQGLCC